MTLAEKKEANRLFWMVKGHLIPDNWSDGEIRAILEGYTVRVWGNHENHVHESGFEAAWNRKTMLLG